MSTAPPQSPRLRALARIAGGGALGLSVLVIGATAAQAHVSVHPDTTAAGAESAEMVFRVPTESDTASTTTLTINLPTQQPLAEVLARPVPGWSVSVKEGKLPTPVTIDGTTVTEAPASVTWKADGAGSGIKPGEYQDFAISAGPLPKSGSVTFTAVQTYSDGSVVKWDQPTVAGQDEPEHPAPSFAITAAAAEDSDAPAASGPAPTTAVKAKGSASDSTARWLGGVGLGLGVIALALATAGRRGRGAPATGGAQGANGADGADGAKRSS